MQLQLDRLPVILLARGTSRTKQYDDIKNGLWTPPVKIGERVSAWPRHETEALNAAYVAGKSADEIRSLVKDLIAKRTSSGEKEAA